MQIWPERREKIATIAEMGLKDTCTIKIQKEISLGRIHGLFQEPPFPNFVCSPLAIRQKSDKISYRLLHNLSYPYDHTSVNANINSQNATVHYYNIGLINQFYKSHHQIFSFKADIEQAYRQCAIQPSDYHLLGFYWDGHYYYDACMPYLF